MSTIRHLNDQLRLGLVEEIFKIDRAYGLIRGISIHREGLHRHFFDELFGTVQHFLMERYVIGLCKLFEKPRGYPIRSVRAILARLSEDANEIPIAERDPLLKALRSSSKQTKDLRVMDDETLTRAFVEHTERELGLESEGNPTRYTAIYRALRAHRDKLHVHPEIVGPGQLPQFTWGESQALLEFAKQFADTFGRAYLLAPSKLTEGAYHLTDEAESLDHHLERIVEAFDKVGGLPYMRSN